MKKPTILIAAPPHHASATRVEETLCQSGYGVLKSTDPSHIQELLRDHLVHLIILVSDPGGTADIVALARHIRRWEKTIPLILITPFSTEELAVAALKTGINDYFKEPFFGEELITSMHRLLGDCRPDKFSRPGIRTVYGLQDESGLIGESRWMRQLKRCIQRIAVTESNVLITGETGTGKELVATMIHRWSSRHQQPFICLNCAAIPDSLLESELFGYERGAFTGAFLRRKGHFERANDGTLFLDEIGEMSPYAQAKILRAIESKEIQRLGGTGSISLDMRIIAATNQCLDSLTSVGKFRRDLFFRLNVARIHLRPLRERREDIPLLLDYHVSQLNGRFGNHIEGFTDETLRALVNYDWPGNVRELKTLLEAIFINGPSRRISLADLPEHCRDLFQQETGPAERDHVLSVMCAMNWNKTQAAKKLQWSRMTLYRKIARYQLTRPSTTQALMPHHS
ncbi:MAG TPA: sigma-54 dependent transcriptional regulator [Nitrospirales bacterium]|jgi:DNA-binding NtrC family response regulator